MLVVHDMAPICHPVALSLPFSIGINELVTPIARPESSTPHTGTKIDPSEAIAATEQELWFGDGSIRAYLGNHKSPL